MTIIGASIDAGGHGPILVGIAGFARVPALA